MKIIFGRFYIKNYNADYNLYFPLKVESLNGFFFIHAQRPVYIYLSEQQQLGMARRF